MSNHYIKDECLQHGQPQAYADHEYIHVITFTQDDWHTPKPGEPARPIIPWYTDETTAFGIARILVPYMDKDDPNANWASRFLVSFDRLTPTPHGNPTLGPVHEDSSDRWRIHVRSVFTD